MRNGCAVCLYLGIEPETSTSPVTIRTGVRALVMAGRRERTAGGPVVVLDVCPAHAVDIYRGRIAGVQMAWRVIAGPAVQA